jgi:hypothetical protein
MDALIAQPAVQQLVVQPALQSVSVSLSFSITSPNVPDSFSCALCCDICHPAGVITLVFLILAATNFRLILENMIKYGFRFNPLTFLRTALTPSGEHT